MLARPDTSRLLGLALFRHWLTSRSVVLILGLMVLATLVTAFVLARPATALLLLAATAFLTAGLAFTSWRSTRAMAPAGFTLGLGLGPTHLAVRHAVATSVTPYSSWASATRSGAVVLLRTRRGGILPLPLELFGADLERAQSLLAGAEEHATPAAGTPLPYEVVCTPQTRGQVFRAVLLWHARRPVVVAGLALTVVAAVSGLLTQEGPPLVSMLACAALVALVAVNLVSTWRRLAACCSPGMPVRAGLLDDALVVEDATGRATVPFRGVDRVFVTSHAVLIRSTLRTSIAFPRALLPAGDLARVQAAVAWYRSRR